MRILFAIVVASAALVSTGARAAESAVVSNSQGAYCLRLYAEGERDCSYQSLAGCNETASGLDGECYAAEPKEAVQDAGAYSLVRPDAASASKRANGQDER